MIYLLLGGAIFWLCLKNVRSIGGFEKGIDYIAAAMVTFISMIIIVGGLLSAIVMFAPTKQMEYNVPLVQLVLPDEEGIDEATYVTIANEEGGRQYNFIYKDDNDILELARVPVVDAKIREVGDGETVVPTYNYSYEVIDFGNSFFGWLARWGLLIDDYLKIEETRYFHVPLKGVRRGYRLNVNDVVALSGEADPEREESDNIGPRGPASGGDVDFEGE